jgi:hypothetical protein
MVVGGRSGKGKTGVCVCVCPIVCVGGSYNSCVGKMIAALVTDLKLN